MSKHPLAVAGVAISALVAGVGLAGLLMTMHGDAAWPVSQGWLMLAVAVGIAGLLVSWVFLFPEETEAHRSRENPRRRGRTSSGGYEGAIGGDSFDGDGGCGGDAGGDCGGD